MADDINKKITVDIELNTDGIQQITQYKTSFDNLRTSISDLGKPLSDFKTSINGLNTDIANAGTIAGKTVADGQGVPTGGATGQVLTKVDGTDFHTQWAIPSGGGSVSGLTPNQILFGKSDGTITQDSTLLFDASTKSLYLGDVQTPVSPSGNIIIVGDSFTVGVAATPNTEGFAYLLAAKLGLSLTNLGRNGTTLGNPARTDALIDNLTLIPTKASSDMYLMFEYGINDVSVGATYTDTDFLNDYKVVLNYAIAHGWSANEIILWTIPWFSMSGQMLAPTNMQARMDAFNAAISGLTIIYPGITVFDAYTLTLNNGQFYLQGSDHFHPSNYGHAFIAENLYRLFVSQLFAEGQTFAINGDAEFQNLKLPLYNLIEDNAGVFVGRKSDGSLGPMPAIPGHTRVAGGLVLDGSIRQTSAVMPDSGSFPGGALQNLDHLFSYLSRLVCVYNEPSGSANPSYFNFIELGDVGMNMVHYVGTPGSYIVQVGGANGLMITPSLLAHFFGHIELDQDKEYRGADEGGTVRAGFHPIHADSGSRLYNNAVSGFYSIEMSNGVDGGSQPVVRIGATGRVVIQNDGSGGLIDDIPCAQLCLNSTTEGFLINRLTTTQRDAIATPAEGLEIYNITLHKKQLFNGTTWETITSV